MATTGLQHPGEKHTLMTRDPWIKSRLDTSAFSRTACTALTTTSSMVAGNFWREMPEAEDGADRSDRIERSGRRSPRTGQPLIGGVDNDRSPLGATTSCIFSYSLRSFLAGDECSPHLQIDFFYIVISELH